MNNNKKNIANNANKIIPEVKENAFLIDGVVKKQNKIIGYRLSNGEIINKEKGVELAKDGMIKGVAVAQNKGNEYLRSLPDENEGNNLSHMPIITQ